LSLLLANETLLMLILHMLEQLVGAKERFMAELTKVKSISIHDPKERLILTSHIGCGAPHDATICSSALFRGFGR
jgi:hypothetical protein